MHLRGYSSFTRALTCYQSSKGGALPDNDQAALPRQLRAEPRSLNDCTAYRKQAGQVSARPGDQSGSGVLRGTIDKFPKLDERLTNAMTY